jgi:hypothetical protein
MIYNNMATPISLFTPPKINRIVGFKRKMEDLTRQPHQKLRIFDAVALMFAHNKAPQKFFV